VAGSLGQSFFEHRGNPLGAGLPGCSTDSFTCCDTASRTAGSASLLTVVRVVSPFASVEGLSLKIRVEFPTEPDEQQAKAQLKKIRIALHDLGLDEGAETAEDHRPGMESG
jgi:hypothetical protein